MTSLGALQSLCQDGIVPGRVGCGDVDGLVLEGGGQVRGGFEAEFPGTLVIDPRPHADKSAVGFAGLTAVGQQVGAGSRQGGGALQPRSLAAIDHQQAFSRLDRLSGGFGGCRFQQGRDRGGLVAVSVTDDLGGIFFEFGLTRVGNDQRGSPFDGLLDAQVP